VSETCGWAECNDCAALVRFQAKQEAGEVIPQPPITSPWWESEAADRLYARGVQLVPPCRHHGETSWP
jgi:hypothetical protein